MPRALGVPALQVARASAVLLGANAWDVTPTVLFCSEAEHGLLTFTFTRGAAGGAFDFSIQVSPYSVAANVPAGHAEWASVTLFVGGALAAGADAQSRVQREYITMQATGAGAESFVYGPVDLYGVCERIRVACRESDAGAVGTLAVSLTLW